MELVTFSSGATECITASSSMCTVAVFFASGPFVCVCGDDCPPPKLETQHTIDEAGEEEVQRAEARGVCGHEEVAGGPARAAAATAAIDRDRGRNGRAGGGSHGSGAKEMHPRGARGGLFWVLEKSATKAFVSRRI